MLSVGLIVFCDQIELAITGCVPLTCRQFFDSGQEVEAGARQAAERAGWASRNGQDFCPAHRGPADADEALADWSGAAS